jgi:hypothetical protein
MGTPVSDGLNILAPVGVKNDPLFDVPKSDTNGYHYILNQSPQILNDRTKIYTEFKAA